jgi:hypothetical protein
MEKENDTPKPGSLLAKEIADRWIHVFVSKFRPRTGSTVASNIPTACLLQGEEVDEITAALPPKGDAAVFTFFENTSEVYCTTWAAVLQYLQKREPWEDYDICVFDESLDWCFGISHEDRLVWVSDTHDHP